MRILGLLSALATKEVISNRYVRYLMQGANLAHLLKLICPAEGLWLSLKQSQNN